MHSTNNHDGGRANPAGGSADLFTKFWADMASRMASSGFGVPGPSPQEAQEAATKAMRQAFFDAWQRHCEDFMRSEAFLSGMKQSMDASLAFKEQLNSFVSKAFEGSPMSMKTDTDSILQILRGLEERVLSRLDDLYHRVDSLEARTGPGAAGTVPTGAARQGGSPQGASPKGRKS